MDHPQRFIFLALAIAWSIFRLIRYTLTATARRPGPAVPPAGGVPPPLAKAPPNPGSAAVSPIEPVRSGDGLAGYLAAVGIFIAGNLVIWPLLFLVPALADVPPLLRMVAGVLANFFLLQVARSVAARVGNSQRGAADENNPIR